MATESLESSGRPSEPFPVVVCAAADPDTLSFVRHFCATLPCITFTTDNADEALRWIVSRQAGIVVADQRLKFTSGMLFLREVERESPATARVLLASYPEHQDLTVSIEERLHSVLWKPWDGPSFRRTILAILKCQEERRRMSGDPNFSGTPTRSRRGFFSAGTPAYDSRRRTGDRSRPTPASRKRRRDP
jgi:DNA-binding NtrC family response regulator